MLLIKNGLLHTMEAAQPISADLLVKNGKIAEIAPDITVTGKIKVLDAAGLLVFPGFIDAHSHIGISDEMVTGIGDECN
jgi:dihydroorotase-like cyclic amidohydrolase